MHDHPYKRGFDSENTLTSSTHKKTMADISSDRLDFENIRIKTQFVRSRKIKTNV